MDEWVTEEDLDTRKVQFPRRDGTQTGASTGVTTPKKLLSVTGSASRPTSPQPGAGEVVNGNAVLAAALQKKINRKRKVDKVGMLPHKVASCVANFILIADYTNAFATSPYSSSRKYTGSDSSCGASQRRGLSRWQKCHTTPIRQYGQHTSGRCSDTYEKHRNDRTGQTSYQTLVLLTLSPGNLPNALHLHLRILLEISQKSKMPRTTLSKVQSSSPAWQRNISQEYDIFL